MRHRRKRVITDLRGLTVSTVSVNGLNASFRRGTGGADKLIVTPRFGINRGAPMSVHVRYAGVPKTYDDPIPGTRGLPVIWLRRSDRAG